MRIVTNEITLEHLFQECSARLKKNFALYLADVPSLELRTAMDYCLSNGGKHIRPLLVYASGSVFHAHWENLDIPAAAVELLHTYSLIHDDLPCMDNADLRRGKPSCHKAFSENMAVLSGDALHTLAMQVISSQPGPLSAERRLHMIRAVSMACGPYGMAAGQAMDLNLLQDSDVSNDLLLETYKLKTGLLLSACVQLGWLASADTNEINQNAMIEFGNIIGLAFQIQDDILDVEGSTENLGKPQNADKKNHKVTYASLNGLEKAKEKVESLYEQAIETINYLGYRAQLLRELTNYLLNRKH